MMEPPIAKDRLTLDTATQMPQDRARSAATTTTTVSLEPAAACACPRCDSEETKFCYFNNYNRAQPRYFCKSCQRYWTAGGVLRNVQPGAGKRKASRAGGSSSEPSTEPPPAQRPRRAGGSDGSGTEKEKELDPREETTGADPAAEGPRATRRRSQRTRRPVDPSSLAPTSREGGGRAPTRAAKTGTNHMAGGAADTRTPASPFPAQFSSWFPYIMHPAAVAAATAAHAAHSFQPSSSTLPALVDAALGCRSKDSQAAQEAPLPPSFWGAMDPSVLMYMHYAFTAQAAAAAAAAHCSGGGEGVGGGGGHEVTRPKPIAASAHTGGFHPFLAGEEGNGGIFRQHSELLAANPSALARSISLRQQVAAGGAGEVVRPCPIRGATFTLAPEAATAAAAVVEGGPAVGAA